MPEPETLLSFINFPLGINCVISILLPLSLSVHPDLHLRVYDAKCFRMIPLCVAQIIVFPYTRVEKEDTPVPPTCTVMENQAAFFYHFQGTFTSR